MSSRLLSLRPAATKQHPLAFPKITEVVEEIAGKGCRRERRQGRFRQEDGNRHI